MCFSSSKENAVPPANDERVTTPFEIRRKPEVPQTPNQRLDTRMHVTVRGDSRPQVCCHMLRHLLDDLVDRWPISVC